MKTENIIPTGDRYLIEIHKAAAKSSSGLLIENNSNVSAAPVLGTVLKAGDTGKFREGQLVMFRRYSVDELKFITEEGEQTVHIVEGSEIIAIIKSDDVISKTI